MNHSPHEMDALQDAGSLEQPLKAVEDQLAALEGALRQLDVRAVDQAATGLHLALAAAVETFGRAARTGSVPPALRHRLARATGQVAAQREALARATASLDRAIDVLIPRAAPSSLYSPAGGNDRLTRSGGGLLA